MYLYSASVLAELFSPIQIIVKTYIQVRRQIQTIHFVFTYVNIRIYIRI
jgi:hypothetical protein